MVNKTPSRRSVLQWGLSAAAGTLSASRLVGSESSPAPVGDRPYAFGFEPVGEIAPVSSLSVEASPLSVGFEVLDRKGFDPSKAYPHLAKLGVKWARCQTGWCRCDTVPGELTFDWLDEVVDTRRRIGIQSRFSLGYGNRLHTPDATDPAAVGWNPMGKHRPRDFPCCIPADTRYSGFGEQPIRSRCQGTLYGINYHIVHITDSCPMRANPRFSRMRAVGTSH